MDTFALAIQLLANLADRASLAGALAIGLLVVIAMVIGDMVDREQRRLHGQRGRKD